jgi:hypothetical protein
VHQNDPRFSKYTDTSPITLSELKQYVFGTGSGYKAVDLLQMAGINPHTSDNPVDDLEHERVDIIMVDSPIVVYYVQGIGLCATPSTTLRIIGQPLFTDNTSNYVIGFKKDADTLRKLTRFSPRSSRTRR